MNRAPKEEQAKAAEELIAVIKTYIMTNFAGTLIVDGVGVGLAAFGFLNPLLAAFIHVTSELAFILNLARLLPGSLPRSRYRS